MSTLLKAQMFTEEAITGATSATSREVSLFNTAGKSSEGAMSYFFKNEQVDSGTRDIKIEVQYSYDGGTQWSVLNSEVNASGGTWDWNISDTENTTVIGKINISDTLNDNTYDLSDGYFTIKGSVTVTNPGATVNETLEYDGGTATYNITWTKLGTMENVTLYYSNNSAKKVFF